MANGAGLSTQGSKIRSQEVVALLERGVERAIPRVSKALSHRPLALTVIRSNADLFKDPAFGSLQTCPKSSKFNPDGIEWGRAEAIPRGFWGSSSQVL